MQSVIDSSSSSSSSTVHSVQHSRSSSSSKRRSPEAAVPAPTDRPLVLPTCALVGGHLFWPNSKFPSFQALKLVYYIFTALISELFFAFGTFSSHVVIYWYFFTIYNSHTFAKFLDQSINAFFAPIFSPLFCPAPRIFTHAQQENAPHMPAVNTSS